MKIVLKFKERERELYNQFEFVHTTLYQKLLEKPQPVQVSLYYYVPNYVPLQIGEIRVPS